MSKNFLYIVLFFILSYSRTQPYNKYAVVVDSTNNDTVTVIDIGDNVYDTLQKKFSKNRFTKLLYNSVIVSSSPISNNAKTDSVENSVDIYKPFSGMVVDSIIIDDITPRISLMGGSDKRVIVKTPDKIIKRIFGIHKGDTINPIFISDMERYLRTQKFISDVRIIIIPKDENNADIKIIKIERFPYSANFSVNSLTSYKIGLNSQNLFRLGAEFNNKFPVVITDRDIFRGYEGELKINNISNKLENIAVRWESSVIRSKIEGSWGRGFVNRATPTAWDIFIRYSNELPNSDRRSIKINTIDTWYGVSKEIGNGNYIYGTTRFNHTKYYSRPEIDHPDSNSSYLGFNNVLAQLTLQNVNYYRTKMLNSYGVTEDVPYGMISKLTFGFYDGEFLNRFYIDFRFGGAKYLGRFGYLSYFVKVGGYVNMVGNIEDLTLTLTDRYYSPLITLGASRLRIIAKGQLAEKDYLRYGNRLSNRENIRYYKGNDDKGKLRLSFSVEPVLFLPWRLAGFRFATFTFIDYSWVSEDNYNIIPKDKMIMGFGGGIRVNNERIVVNELKLAVAYYPNINNRGSSWGFSFATTVPKLFSPFSVGKPETIHIN